VATTRLRFQVQELPEQGLDIAVDTQVQAFRETVERAREGDGAVRGQATLRVEASRERVDVRGRVSAELPLLCSRCADPFRWSGGADIDVVLLRPRDEGEETPRGERELHAQEMDERELLGDELDLVEILGEELLLALPDQPLCRVDCKGICAGCGAELNREPCRCPPEVDERWAKLAGWGKKGG
jgi:uncharacterized protein